MEKDQRIDTLFINVKHVKKKFTVLTHTVFHGSHHPPKKLLDLYSFAIKNIAMGKITKENWFAYPGNEFEIDFAIHAIKSCSFYYKKIEHSELITIFLSLVDSIILHRGIENFEYEIPD